MSRAPSSTGPARRPSPRERARRRAERGFTLVELLMASAAGLVVSAAAFLLAKNASAVFQEETRITAAQLSASLGLSRLASDISRAGFLSTPNIATDPYVCDESATWPPLLTNYAALRLVDGGSVTNDPAALAQSTANGFNPDAIELTGSFDSAELFPVRTIEVAGGGKIVHLETSNLSIKRTCKEKTLAQCAPDIQRIFAAERVLRILTPSGKEIFGLVDHTDVTDKIEIHLQATPTVPTVAFNVNGYEPPCTYCLVNTISTVRYQLASLQGHPQYGAMLAPAAAAATGDLGRTELVRVELDKQGNPLPDTLELVAEYAVDLKFGISWIDPASSAVTDVPITDPATPAVYTVAPERIRSVHVRFSTRARAPDRDTGLPAGPDGRKHRFELPIAGKTTFARMRTLYTEVALQNLVRATW